jgi:hypothetical protein
VTFEDPSMLETIDNLAFAFDVNHWIRSRSNHRRIWISLVTLEFVKWRSWTFPILLKWSNKPHYHHGSVTWLCRSVRNRTFRLFTEGHLRTMESEPLCDIQKLHLEDFERMRTLWLHYAESSMWGLNSGLNKLDSKLDSGLNELNRPEPNGRLNDTRNEKMRCSQLEI